MAVLRRWTVTSSIELLPPLMAMRMDDDDQTDVFMAYIQDGICFGSWSGYVQVKVYASRNGCGEAYRIERSVNGGQGVIASDYNKSQLHAMIDDIYTYIQLNSRNGQ